MENFPESILAVENCTKCGGSFGEGFSKEVEVFAKGKEGIVEEAGGFSKEWKDLLKESEDLHVLNNR
jgi:hypothetical protein